MEVKEKLYTIKDMEINKKMVVDKLEVYATDEEDAYNQFLEIVGASLDVYSFIDIEEVDMND